ncbi:MAG: DUF1854 domain-containing protein [Verrucomicrobiae bacterium]|nr:DUF1854 domain-containing protein [Verrucomicrobiae bacterium]
MPPLLSSTPENRGNPAAEFRQAVERRPEPGETILAWMEPGRGPAFFLIDSEESLRRVGPFTALFIDTHGVRCLIPDIWKLPRSSRRLMEQHW